VDRDAVHLSSALFQPARPVSPARSERRRGVDPLHRVRRLRVQHARARVSYAHRPSPGGDPASRAVRLRSTHPVHAQVPAVAATHWWEQSSQRL